MKQDLIMQFILASNLGQSSCLSLLGATHTQHRFTPCPCPCQPPARPLVQLGSLTLCPSDP